MRVAEPRPQGHCFSTKKRITNSNELISTSASLPAVSKPADADL